MTTYPCPHCGSPATLETGCPSCGRGPDPDAAEVIRTDAEITTLIAELATARTAVTDLENRIGLAWQRRHAAARVRAALGPQPQPETSSRAVQNLLFTLGGLLLGVAAIVFAAVAWSQFGVTGRAVLLGVATVVALAVPPLALRRGLTATAETLAAVGVLLTLLCGYAAWSVDLFGVAGGSAVRYAGVVCLLTAAIAAGYALMTGLRGPRWQALLIFQPALPLLVLPSNPGLAGWSLTFGAIAAVDLAVRRARVAPAAYACAILATLLAAVPAAISGFRTLGAAQPFFHAAWLAAVPYAGWHLPVVLTVVTAALFGTVPPRLRPASLVAGAAAVALALPAGLHLPWWNGPIIDMVVVLGVLILAARRAAPVLHAPAARVAALPAAASPATPSAAASAVALGTRAATSPRAVALGARAAGSSTAAALGTRAATSSTAVAFVTQLVTAVLLAGHALIAAFGRPGVAAGTLIALALLGAALAVRAQHPALAGVGLCTTLVALPAIAWTGTVALGRTPATQALFVAAAAALALLLIALADTPPAAAPDAPASTPAPWPGAPAGTPAPWPGAPAGAAATVSPAAPAVAGLARLVGSVLGGRPGAFAEAASVARRVAIVPLGLTLLSVLPGLAPGVGTTVVLGLLLVAGAVVGAAGGTPVARGLGMAVAVAVGLDAALTRPAGTVLESYSMIASGLALAAALLTKRDHSSSWTTYGPALIIGLVPSLVSVLTNDGQHLRRLLLGLAALAILLAGAKARLRAPVIAGGTTLALVALHELVLAWDLIPRWIPLAAGGLLLVLLAATLESRRRDLARFRHAIGRMS
ncbi:hypothetical protein ODJ79_29815 [Actinoplanes sp. KI2]|uniref:SCO7613 C-terminal domain-containing membrane protein n=1 Tax=Actinoplanes sp. KI2 TaxID=2983315 RepID=UPI0021D5DF85|nr:hypothetical protein [Actinoplanes sp. KI2]MCU7727935.1 hypothetical protein [Actinoplanes sp. KI2]